MKKSTIIGITVFVLTLIGGGLYYFLVINKPVVDDGEDLGDEEITIFPNESGGIVIPPDTANNTGSGGKTSSGQISRLRKIAVGPIAGAGIVEKASSTVFRYMERGTGRVFEISPKETEAVRLTNNTIPAVAEAVFSTNSDIVIFQYIKSGTENIETIVGSIVPKGGGEGEVVGEALPRDITSFALSPSNKEVFYIRGKNGAEGVVKTIGTDKRQSIFASPLSEWLTSWTEDGAILVQTKPSGLAEGVLYLLNPKTGSKTAIDGREFGLTGLISSDQKTAVVGYSNSGGYELALRDTRMGNSLPISLETLPEKCVWNKNVSDEIICGVPEYMPIDVYPDAWYQGIANFRDEIWTIDRDTGNGELLFKISESAKTNIDVYNPHQSSDGKYLLFTNKNDLSLWVLQLEE